MINLTDSTLQAIDELQRRYGSSVDRFIDRFRAIIQVCELFEQG